MKVRIDRRGIYDGRTAGLQGPSEQALADLFRANFFQLHFPLNIVDRPHLHVERIRLHQIQAGMHHGQQVINLLQ